jgi:hypothetical protein
MSHTIVQNNSTLKALTVAIPNYTVGGETFTFADFGIATFATSLAQMNGGLLLGQVPPNQNSLGVVLFPVWTGTTLKLFQFVSGSPVEIPTTSALNATFSVLLYS